MKRLLFFGALAALVSAGPACAADPDESLLVESGRKSFQRHCSACHGMDGSGNGILKPVLRVAPSDLTRIAARRGGEFPDAEIAAFIDGRSFVAAHGSREMPVWGRIFGEPVVEDGDAEEVVRGQLWILVEYLKSIQVPPLPPGD
jgi:mono/diheme cytochrome c family protein